MVCRVVPTELYTASLQSESHGEATPLNIAVCDKGVKIKCEVISSNQLYLR